MPSKSESPIYDLTAIYLFIPNVQCAAYLLLRDATECTELHAQCSCG